MTVVEVDTEVSRVAESDSDVCFLSHLKNTSHWQVSYLGEESHNVHDVFKGEKNFLSSPNVIVLWHTYSLAPTPTPTSSQAKGNPVRSDVFAFGSHFRKAAPHKKIEQLPPWPSARLKQNTWWHRLSSASR